MCSINNHYESKVVDMRGRTASTRWGDVLMVSPAGTGHVTPMMHLAKGLMERGISITVVVPEDELAIVEKKVEPKYLEAGGLMNFELVMSLGKLKVKDGGLVGMFTDLESVCEPLFQKLLSERESGGVQMPKCMVADQFLGWTQVAMEPKKKLLHAATEAEWPDLSSKCSILATVATLVWANKLEIPRYVSFASPAIYALLMLCHGSLEDQVERASDNKDPNLIFNIPRLPVVLHKADLPESFLLASMFQRRVINLCGDSFKEAAGILFNTFYELEPEAIVSFQANAENMNPSGKVPRMLPIGPMLPSAFFEEGVFVNETTENSECIQWLDSRPAASVLYIAFGSWVSLSPPQIQELAHALEATRVPFLWILRVQGSLDESGGVSRLLPPGFCARTQNQGFISTEFAPQLQILSHPATGGFMTHCGWNSSLESISRGVPMIGWPDQAEQGLCCRVLVDLAKVAIQVIKGPNKFASREDIGRALSVLMKEPQGQELKRRAAELQQQARAAVSPGGSSHRNLNWLVKAILSQP